MSRTRPRPELVIIAIAVVGVLVCVVLIGRRWADRERARRPEPDQPPVPALLAQQLLTQPLERTNMPIPRTTINALAFTPDGKRLIIAGSTPDRRHRDQPVVRVWDTAEEREVAAFTKDGEVGRHVAVAVSPNGKYVAAAGLVVANKLVAVNEETVGRVSVWDLESEKPWGSASPAGGIAQCVAWSPDGSQLAAGDTAGTITVWTWRGLPRRDWATQKDENATGISCLAWSGDGKRLASAGSDRVRVWDVGERRQVVSLLERDDSYTGLAFTPDNWLVSVGGGAKSSVWVWDLDRQRRNLTTHDTVIGGFALGPGGKSFITVNNNVLLTVEPSIIARGWETASGRELWTVYVPTDDIRISPCPFAVTPDGRHLALADMERTDNELRWTVTLYDLPPPPE